MPPIETSSNPRALTRRELRLLRASTEAAETTPETPDAQAPQSVLTDTAALRWVDPRRVDAASGPPPRAAREDGLLADAPRRLRIRGSVLTPLVGLVALVAVYVTAMGVWPLHEVAPTVEQSDFTATASPAADITWPDAGTSAVGIAGVGVAASSDRVLPMASVTKVVSALMVLDRSPLALGESGPEFSFTRSDRSSYQSYLWRGESALAVPVGGTLTQYQLLQGTLIGSANNYIDRLAREIWGSNADFAIAAEEWLAARQLTGITVVEPSGFDSDNTADAASLVTLGELAMANPVIREIVGTVSVELPGAGEVINTNPLLGIDGTIGVKTGKLSARNAGMDDDVWNVLTAREITIGETVVPLTVAIVGQPTAEARLGATVSLLDQLTAALSAQGPTVPAGTVVGQVTTIWGESVSVQTDADVRVVGWDSSAVFSSVTLELGESRAGGDQVGTLTVRGPIDQQSTTVSLTDPIEGPDLLWRITHPLELLGLTSR